MRKKQLKLFLLEVREFLFPYWQEWNEEFDVKYASQNTCGRSSVFLQKLIEDSLELKCKTTFGFIQDLSKQKHRHAWVQTNKYILDITADQFGYEDVIIAVKDDLRYSVDIDTAYPEYQEQRALIARLLLDKWVEQKNI